MLSREMHLEQVNRFHDLRESIDAKIEQQTKESPTGKFNEEEYKYLQAFVAMMRIWPSLDDACEDAKNRMDIIEFELKKEV